LEGENKIVFMTEDIMIRIEVLNKVVETHKGMATCNSDKVIETASAKLIHLIKMIPTDGKDLLKVSFDQELQPPPQ
jgi:hypothetical protein